MQIKKQLINVLTATVFTFLSMLLFKVVASSMIAGYGDFAKEAFAMASSKLFSKVIILIIVSAIVYAVLSFTKAKYTKLLYIIWGIVTGIICFAVCAKTNIYYDGAAEIKAMATVAIRTHYFVYGIAFPLFQLLMCILACGKSLKANIVNQAISTVCFLLLFWIFSLVTLYLLSLLYLGIAIAACMAVIITYIPALNMEYIKTQIKKPAES